MSRYKPLAHASQALLVLFIFLHASVAVTSGSCTCLPNPTTTIVLYAQTIFFTGTNSNYTDYPVAGIQGTEYSITQFGTIFVFDEPVTISASPTSTMVGRFRGIYTVSALSGDTFFLTSTILFTGGQYANSSLNIKGLGSTLLNVPSQLAIDGGTNVFNNAIGNVTVVENSSSGPYSVYKIIINTNKAF